MKLSESRNIQKFLSTSITYDNKFFIPEFESLPSFDCKIFKNCIFIIINHKTKEVHLIEVKYMGELSKGKVASAARKIQKSWKRAALFIASPDGFYFDTVEDIIANKGEIKPFKHPKITAKTQTQYIDLLNEFIQI